MNRNPFLSIIIPVYNAAPYLAECVNSILQQTFTDYEIILVDDGSVDDSPVICDTFVAKDPRIRCIHQKNSGHTAARQAGFCASAGRYVAFVDSDDWVSPDMYTRLCGIALETDADIVHCDFIAAMPDREKTCRAPFAPGYYDKERLMTEVYPQLIYSGTFFVFGAAPNLWNKLFHRELLEKYLFQIPHEIKIGEDGLITYGCMLEARSIYFTDGAHYYYRSRTTSLCHNVESGYLAANRLLFDTYMKMLDLERYPMIRRQLDYFFTYQSLLIQIPAFRSMSAKGGDNHLSGTELRKRFLAECSDHNIQRAFAAVRLRDISGQRNRLCAFCIRRRLFIPFMLLIK